eukprot:CAMPEP_0118662932 /NCGR_PEP_ID=MMETSP0785-20121206/17109_1 /TAXON_ID=91992 /ORGANISM="Bolidomonas pacifica, Strain CCMP 1866" /LENGTH=72 /DNA_ID=CAMNT_0006556537 /DNA_START=96 /DNA_END=314 /DNA_ORIENTATION=-
MASFAKAATKEPQLKIGETVQLFDTAKQASMLMSLLSMRDGRLDGHWKWCFEACQLLEDADTKDQQRGLAEG